MAKRRRTPQQDFGVELGESIRQGLQGLNTYCSPKKRKVCILCFSLEEALLLPQYRAERNYENLNKGIFLGTSDLGIPYIADSTRSGNVYSIGGWGGQAHGGGMYMTDDYSGTRYYGTQHVIGAVFNSKSNHIDGGSLLLKADSWLKSHPKMRDSLAKIAGAKPGDGTHTILTRNEYRARSIAALAMGYTSIGDKVLGNEHYYVILDRSTLSTSRYNHRKPMKVSGT